MAVYDNTYSRVVSWLKILLPLLALAILSTLFLVARTIDPAQTLPFADVDIEELTREQRIGKPTFSGVTAGGAAYTLSAARARPDPARGGRITGEDVRAQFDLPDGIGIDVTAGAAEISQATRMATLASGVVAKTTNGYLFEAPDLNVAFDDSRAWSDGAVSATGPGLRLKAGSFELTGNGTADNPHLLVFKGRVNLLYEPQQ